MRSLALDPVVPYRVPDRPFQVVVVGCGGNGSHVAHGLGRLGYHLRASGGPALNVVLIDGDRFEQKNVGRQLARPRDVGVNKAQALAARISSDYGLRFEAIPTLLDQELLNDLIGGHEDPERSAARVNLVVVGCVDRSAARATIHAALPARPGRGGWLWLDLGNHEHTGQVALGSVRAWSGLHGSLAIKGLCAALPSPGLLLPDLIAPPKQPRGRPRKVAPAPADCADDVAANRQAFNLNAVLATIAVEYLTQLITQRAVTRLRTTVDLAALTAASDPITAATLTVLSGVASDQLRGLPARPTKGTR